MHDPAAHPLPPPRRRRRSWWARARRWGRKLVQRAAMLVLSPVMASALGCATTAASNDDADVVVTMAVAPAAPVAAPAPPGPPKLGDFHVTFYYVIGEDEIDGPGPLAAAPAPANDNARLGAALGAADPVIDDSRPEPGAADVVGDGEGGTADVVVLASVAPKVTLYDGSGCAPVAEVSRGFAAELRMQGTGRLRDGRILNIWGDCACERSPCFHVTGRQWGNAGNGRPLQPFRTVAVDPKLIRMGSLLYVEALDGRRMPGKAPWGGFVHDGCVAADDTGGGIDGHQIDLFVGRRAYYRALAGSGGSHGWSKQAKVIDGSALCERVRGQVRRARQAS